LPRVGSRAQERIGAWHKAAKISRAKKRNMPRSFRLGRESSPTLPKLNRITCPICFFFFFLAKRWPHSDRRSRMDSDSFVQLTVEDDCAILGISSSGLVAPARSIDAQPAHPQCESRRPRIGVKKAFSSGPRCHRRGHRPARAIPASVLREARRRPRCRTRYSLISGAGEEGGARTDESSAADGRRVPQTAVRIPGKRTRKQQKEQRRSSRERQIERKIRVPAAGSSRPASPARVNGVPTSAGRWQPSRGKRARTYRCRTGP